jgi:hypothetical protein
MLILTPLYSTRPRHVRISAIQTDVYHKLLKSARKAAGPQSRGGFPWALSELEASPSRLSAVRAEAYGRITAGSGIESVNKWHCQAYPPHVKIDMPVVNVNVQL